MENIKVVLKRKNENTGEYEENEYSIDAETQSQWFNESKGDLNLDDGIECAICKNKGKISFVEKGHEHIKDCECMKARKTVLRLRNCGITKSFLEKYSFQNWNTDNDWQNALLSKCKDFFKHYIHGNKYWFILSGQSGSGKTHLCTALFQELMRYCFLNGNYMMWNDEIPKLLSLRKSSYIDNQEKYEKLINLYKECDILYIDDLFKLDTRYKEESLSIAYEILNYRYINDKIVLISTEVERDQFENLDTAIWGRCFEKTNRGEFWITLTGKEKNYRI